MVCISGSNMDTFSICIIMSYKVIAESVLLLSIVDFDVCFAKVPLHGYVNSNQYICDIKGVRGTNSMMFHILIIGG